MSLRKRESRYAVSICWAGRWIQGSQREVREPDTRRTQRQAQALQVTPLAQSQRATAQARALLPNVLAARHQDTG